MKKRILALFLSVLLAFSLVACGGEPADTDTGAPSDSDVSASVGSENGESSDVSSDKGEDPELKGYDKTLDHKFIACDIRNHGIVVFDLNAVDGDPKRLEEPAAVVWEWRAEDDPNCKGVSKIKTSISGVRYRYSEYYKKDVVVACASYGWIGIIDYETRTVLWESTDPILGNVHSVEMLPNGDVIAAVSADPGAVAYFAVTQGSTTPSHSVPSLWSHGVFWDPAEECLWVLEAEGVVQVYVQNMGKENVKLLRVTGSGATFVGDGGGHAFAPIAGESGKYWASAGKKLWVFDSAEGTLTNASSVYVKSDIKGVCSFTDGTVVQAVAGLCNANEKGFGSDGLRVILKEVVTGKVSAVKDVEYVVPFANREFYKVQAFTKNYQ